MQMLTAARRSRSGFTLIELLVVIAIISLLVAILLPALAKARALGRQVKEMANAQQMATAWSAYANDFKGGLLIPYIHWTWAHPHTGAVFMMPEDPTWHGRMLEGDVIKVWPWRFMTYAGYSDQNMQTDKATMATISARPRTPSGSNGTFSNMYDNPLSYQYAMGWHTSFGLNGVYIGGHYRLGAFQRGTANASGHTNPKFYISKLEEAFFPSKLIVGATSRSTDVATAGRGTIDYGGRPVPWQPNRANFPGYYLITPPTVGFPTNGGSATAWVQSNKFDTNTNPADWGFVDFRHFDKSVTFHMDGHVETMGIRQMRDMRHWANQATRENWLYGQR